jgi:MFS family permease
LVGFAVSQLISGTVADIRGRRPVAFVGGGVFVAASLLACLAPSYGALAVARLLQGIGVGFLNVPLRAAILDVYKGDELYKMANYVTISWALAPIVAPALGGYLQEGFGWRASFALLLVYGSLILFCVWRMPETLPEAATQKNAGARGIVASWLGVLGNPACISDLVSLGLLYLSAVLFSVVGSFYIQALPGYTAQSFGLVALVMGVLWLLGNVLNRALHRVAISRKMVSCYLGMGINCICMLYFSTRNPTYALGNIGVQIFLSSILFPNFYARAMGLLPNSAGVVAAVMGTSMILIAGLGSAAATLLERDSLVGLSIGYLVITIVLVGLQLPRKMLGVGNSGGI